MKIESNIKVLLDSNIFDKILNEKLTIFSNPKLVLIKFQITHIQYDEISDIPDEKLDLKIDLLELIEVLKCEVVETEGFVQGISKLGLAKLFSNEDLPQFFEISGNENGLKDGLLAVTAKALGSILVTEDVDLRKRCLKHEIGVWNWSDLVAFLNP